MTHVHLIDFLSAVDDRVESVVDNNRRLWSVGLVSLAQSDIWHFCPLILQQFDRSVACRVTPDNNYFRFLPLMEMGTYWCFMANTADDFSTV